MRFPVVHDISTKDGASNRNARLVNALKETNSQGDKAVIRPGLVDAATATGNGNGLVAFNGELISVFGSEVSAGIVVVDPSWALDYKNYNNSAQRITPFAGGFIIVTDDGAGSGVAKIEHTDDFLTYTTLLDSTSATYAFNTNEICTNGTHWFMGATDLDTDEAYVVKINAALSVSLLSGNFYGQIWNGSHFIGPISATETAYSPDGVAWTSGTARTRAATGPQKMAWNGGGQYVLAIMDGYDIYAYTSTDGLTWSGETLIASTNMGFAVAFGNGKFIIAADDSNFYSTNGGATWTAGGMFPMPTIISAMDYNPTLDMFIAVGNYDFYGQPETVLISDDGGLTWTSLIDAYDGIVDYRDVVATDDGFVAIGAAASPSFVPHINIATYTSGSATVTPVSTLTDTKFDFVQSIL